MTVAWLSTKDVAAWLGVSTTTVLRMERDGRLPAPRRLSRKTLLWSSLDIEAWMSSHQAHDMGGLRHWLPINPSQPRLPHEDQPG